MNSKTYSTCFFAFLISSSLAVIPDGEIKIGPVFDPAIASRFFGHKHFEGVFHKTPIKKLLLGAGALGAGALAAGGAALLANKIHHSGGFGGIGGSQHYAPSYGSGWGGWTAGNTNNAGYPGSGLSFPSSSSDSSYYQQQQQYQPEVDYSQSFAGAQSSSGGYPSSSYYDSSAYNYNGWSR